MNQFHVSSDDSESSSSDEAHSVFWAAGLPNRKPRKNKRLVPCKESVKVNEEVLILRLVFIHDYLWFLLVETGKKRLLHTHPDESYQMSNSLPHQISLFNQEKL